MSRVLGVIPARYASSRFPGKLLADLCGRPLISWVIRGAKKSSLLSEIVVATDHSEIAKVAQAEDVQVVMTDPNLASGTDRIWQACRGDDFDALINIQGDEPLVDEKVLDPLVNRIMQGDVSWATLARPLLADELDNPNAVKLVTDCHGRALYFSRLPIPFSRQAKELFQEVPVFKHIGLYAYTRQGLESFCQADPCFLEKAEGLEQLRALYLGLPIGVVLVEDEGTGVDTPEDLEKVKSILERKK